MKKLFLQPLCLATCLFLISCNSKQNKEITPIETNQGNTAIAEKTKTKEPSIEKPVVKEAIETNPPEPKSRYDMALMSPGDKIQYGLVDLAGKTINGWNTKMIGVIGKDTLDIPLPMEPSYILYFEQPDLNGNGYNDVLLVTGFFGTCCSPDYTIASYDGKKFRLTQTIGWVKDYDIERKNGYSLFHIERDKNSKKIDASFKDKVTYEYKDYKLKELKGIHTEPIYIKADTELVTKDLYDDRIPRTTMSWREGIDMPYKVDAKDSLRIIALPGPGRGLLEVYLFDDKIGQHYSLVFMADRVGILPIKHEGYPLLVVDVEDIYTKDGPYTGDVQKIYKQLKKLGRR